MGSNSKPVAKSKYDMVSINRAFTTNLESLKLFITNLSPVAKKHDEVSQQKKEKFLNEFLKICRASEIPIQKENHTEIKPKFTQKQQNHIISFLMRHIKDLSPIPPPNVELLYKSSFVILISYFDFLISDLLRYFHRTYPETLSGKELSLTLNELKLFDDISESIDYALNKEVDKVLYGPLEDQKRYFKNYLKIDIKDNIINWPKINEAVERRNIIVHNNSIINRRYLKNTDPSLIPTQTNNFKEGQKITLNQDYLMTVFDELLIAGVILNQSCWRKWEKNSIDTADTTLILIIYDPLSQGKWSVAERLGLFSKDCQTHNERNRLYLDINYCQSLKWQNKDSELAKELEKFDVSTLRPIYLLAYYALKSDIVNFYKYVKNAIILDSIDLNAFWDWPLFREFRDNPDYIKTIKSLFKSAEKVKTKSVIKDSNSTPTNGLITKVQP